MKKQYADSRNSRETMGRLRTDLRDVQGIMLTNIQDVMSRGEALTGRCSTANGISLSAPIHLQISIVRPPILPPCLSNTGKMPPI